MSMFCLEHGCDRPATLRGLCTKHYQTLAILVRDGDSTWEELEFEHRCLKRPEKKPQTPAKDRRKRMRAKRVYAGNCGNCGKPRELYAWLCNDCADKHRTRQLAENRVTLSVCERCGKKIKGDTFIVDGDTVGECCVTNAERGAA